MTRFKAKERVKWSLITLTHVNVDFGAGDGQTHVIGHGHVDAVDAGVVEEMMQHHLALFGGLHHVACGVNGLQALCIQNHAAHLFGEAE